ncbi:MAG: hypothetical protein Q9191_006418 [Dirinaria sp. TL-2023a]
MPVASNPHSGFGGSEQERRNFNFFCTRTIPQLSGFFGSEFWEKLVPRTTYHHPAIKHAVLALGSLHERFEQGDTSVYASNLDIAQGGFALQQYNKAIQQLIKATSRQQLDICLISCVLFACFENLRGHLASAMSHIQGGVRILEGIGESIDDNFERLENKQEFNLAPRSKFEVLFNRLDSQVNQLLGTKPMTLRPTSQATQVGFGPHIPQMFSSLEEARNSLDYQMNCLSGYIISLGENSPSEDLGEEQRTFWRNTMSHWDTAFEKFLDNPATHLDAKSQQGALVLQMEQRIKSLFLLFPTHHMFANESIWDDHVSVGEEIVEMAEKVVALDGRTQITEKPVFSCEVTIITPLYAVAHKCRDPYVRRRAIALLRSLARQEGIWNSCMAAHVAERIMNVEESGLGEIKSCRDVPKWARISYVTASFDPMEKKVSLKYTRQKSQLVEVQEDFSEILTW